MNLYHQTGSSNLIGLKLEVVMASNLFIMTRVKKDQYLNFTTLWADSADRQTDDIFFLFFLENGI